MNRLPLIILTLLLLIAGCNLLPSESNPTPIPTSAPQDFAEEVARAYLKAWSAGDYNAMYAMVAPSRQATISASDFVTRYRQLVTETTLISVRTSVISVLEEGSTAEVSFSAAFQTSVVGTFEQENTMSLRREEGRWGVLWSPNLIFAQLNSGYSARLLPLSSPRGDILDRGGKPLTAPRQLVSVDVVPAQMRNENQVLTALARALGKSAAEIKATYAQYPGNWRTSVGTLTPETFKANLSALSQPGILTDKTTDIRSYPRGASAAHIVGYVGLISAEELDKLRAQGYRDGDVVGKSGLEAWGEPVLSGTRGGRLVILTPGNTITATLADVPANQSENIHSTVDLDVQDIAIKALGSRRGAVVVMDVSNGDVLAMVSHPTFDPNRISQKMTPQEFRALMNDPTNPLVNRAAQSAFLPGSVFKIVAYVAAIEKGGMSATTLFNDPGYWDGLGPNFRKVCWIYPLTGRGHGTLSLASALVQSCNVAFYQVGQRLDNQNRNLLADYARALGLGSLTGIEIGEAAGNIPDPNNQVWRPGDPINMVIGQGDVVATPLQIASMMAAIANGGTLYRPRLVSRISSIAKRTEQVFEPTARARLPISPETLASLRDSLRKVTQDPNGTAYHAFRGAKVVSAGKTGTAEILKGGEPHSWFAGYAPANAPRIAVVVIAEHGGEGSKTAAPIFREIVEKYFALPQN